MIVEKSDSYIYSQGTCLNHTLGMNLKTIYEHFDIDISQSPNLEIIDVAILISMEIKFKFQIDLYSMNESITQNERI